MGKQNCHIIVQVVHYIKLVCDVSGIPYICTLYNLTNFMSQSISVFYCCITNYHKLSSLKQHKFIVLHFPIQKSRPGLAGSSTSGSIKRIAIKMPPGPWFHQKLIWEKICFQALSFVGRNHLHRGVELRSPFSCWLLTGIHSQHLETTTVSYHLISP